MLCQACSGSKLIAKESALERKELKALLVSNISYFDFPVLKLFC